MVSGVERLVKSTWSRIKDKDMDICFTPAIPARLQAVGGCGRQPGWGIS